MTKAETIFAHELSQIHTKEIKQFVIDCFDKLCPDYFWTCPCSTTGKYHPQVSLGVGGLVRHTKLAVWWGLELLRALGNSPELYNIPDHLLYDEAIATLLLHDMLKNGKGLNAQGYSLEQGVTGTHGVTLVKKMLDLDAGEGVSTRILAGIAGHMGIWTTDPAYRPDNIPSPDRKAFAQLIHLVDYCASRKVDEIYHKLQGERDDIIESPAKETFSKSPSCPCDVCKTESRQTTAAENGQ
ncbi:hypothetical protein LCGC14_0437230 [marine sediment metagenome]|uniref:HD domain-containing protein n=1 Tax=marine sediment metagenome TaxID=412755 RepID=A0A0F9T4M5_9ZZZZ